jgi:hypothetical protein
LLLCRSSSLLRAHSITRAQRTSPERGHHVQRKRSVARLTIQKTIQ